MRRPIINAFAVLALSAGLAACAASEETTMKLHSLEEKVNQALQNAAAARVDATTALHLAVQNEKK